MPGGKRSTTFVIGVPWRKKKLDRIAAARLALFQDLVLLERWPAAGQEESVVTKLANRKLAEWLDKVVDNMAAKSTAFLGLLSLSSALVGLSIVTKTGNSRYSLALLVLIFFIAILQFLNLRVVAWRDPEVYKDPEKEAAHLMRLAANRSARLMLGMFLFLLGGLAWTGCELYRCELCDAATAFVPSVGGVAVTPGN